MKWLFQTLLLLMSITAARAEEVEFPEDELAQESVLPVFEKRNDVLHRHVVTNKRLEIGAGGGLEIDEPFYNDVLYSGHLGYHFTDQHAINVDGLFWTPGLSSYALKIRNDKQFGGWDASKAPHPRYGVMGNYEFTAYYGKISITKQTVMNLNLFAYAGPLFISMQGYNAFGGDIGIGQNFFITPRFAIRADLRMLIFQAPNAATQNLQNGVNPKPQDFQTRIFYNNQMQLSLVVLL